MSRPAPDRLVSDDNWSDLSRFRVMPTIDFDRLHGHRLGRIKAQAREADAAMCTLVSPISLRYAVDCGGFELLTQYPMDDSELD